MIKLAVLCLLVPSLASADPFEAKAHDAIRVTRADDVVWALTASCDKGDDVQQRQCRQVRDRKAKQLASSTLWIDADADAFELGAWSSAKKSVPITLTACVRCNGVEVDGHTYYLTGPGAKLDGSRMRASVLYDNARQVPDESAATAWKTAAGTVRVEMIVKVIDKRKFSVGGKDGLAFDIVGWRVVNACEGTVVISSVPSGPVTADRKACAARSGGGGGGGGGGGTGEVLPDALTPAMVQDGMKPVVAAARACFDRMKTSGKTKVEVTINGDGSVAKHELIGDFVGTPMGKCIDDAMKKAQFPRTKKPTTKVGYPIVLQ